MHIVINGRYLSKPTSGYGRTISNLLPALALLDQENHYTILTPKEFNKNLGPNFEFEVLNEQFNRTWWEQVQIPERAYKIGADILYYPYSTLPFFSRGLNLVVNINNTIPWKFPEFKKGFFNKIRQPLKVSTFKEAEKIITVSDFSKSDIAQTFDINPQKIEAVYQGINPIFKRGITNVQADMIKRRYKISKNFIFCVSSFDLRKNLKKLIEAFSILLKKGHDMDLMLGGSIASTRSPFSYSFEELALYASEFGISNRVKFIRLVPTEDLMILFNLASIFAYPSLYEGFSSAVIEAASCGTPVCASNTSCFPEIVGEAGVLFNPADANEMALAMDNLLTNEALRNDLIQKGYKRAKSFTWENSARCVLRIFQEIREAKGIA